MSSLRTTLILFAMVILPATGDEQITFTRLKSPPESLTETFFQIPTTGTIDIGGDIIERINMHTETGKSHAGLIIIYKNTTPEAVSPKYVIRFYNAYGILMGGVRVPADEKTPEAKISSGVEGIKVHEPRITSLDSLFRNTNMTAYPADFFSVSWLSISDSNDKKIEQAAAKPSETEADKKAEEADASKPEPK